MKRSPSLTARLLVLLLMLQGLMLGMGGAARAAEYIAAFRSEIQLSGKAM